MATTCPISSERWGRASSTNTQPAKQYCVGATPSALDETALRVRQRRLRNARPSTTIVVPMDRHHRNWRVPAEAPFCSVALFAGVVLLGLLGCGGGPEILEQQVRPESKRLPEGTSDRESESDPEPLPGSERGARESEDERAGQHESEGEHEGEHGSGGEHGEESGESGIQYGRVEAAQEVRSGVHLELRYDVAAETFIGTVVNTTAEPVARVRVEVHLSNGVELGPTPRISLAPGETSSVRLEAEGQRFEAWTTHVEIGEGEHGERHR